jgi:hypothetical protein
MKQNILKRTPQKPKPHERLVCIKKATHAILDPEINPIAKIVGPSVPLLLVW